LAARNRPIPVINYRSVHGYTDHTTAASLLYNMLVLESLLGRLVDSLLGSLLERATFEKAEL
jgi:hypothetical protein